MPGRQRRIDRRHFALIAEREIRRRQLTLAHRPTDGNQTSDEHQGKKPRATRHTRNLAGQGARGQLQFDTHRALFGSLRVRHAVMPEFEHERHKPPRELVQPRELVVVCAPMRSNINLSRIARAASCCGLTRMICCGPGQARSQDCPRCHRYDPNRRPSHARAQCWRNCAKKDTGSSAWSKRAIRTTCTTINFERRTALVIGNERTGLTDDILKLLDAVVEIPVWGLPFSYNVATATSMCLYEYCRQFPDG